jgi:DNA polymerase I
VGKYSQKDVAARKELAARIVEPMLQSKKDRTQVTIYKRFEPGEDGCVHTSLSIDTASNRLSSSESPIYPNSTNLQNAPKMTARLDPLYTVRDVVIAPPGEVIVCCDFKNAEAILVGSYSNDWEYVNKILTGVDTHKEHAQHFYGTDVITGLQRDIAKTITYASFYYAKIPTLQQHLNKRSDETGIYFKQDEVFRLWSILMQLHPLQAWWSEIEQLLAKNNGWLRNCFGYRRKFHDPKEHNRLKDGLSFLPQSTVAWLMNTALPKVREQVVLTGMANMRLQVHDELFFTLKEENVPQLVATVSPLLERHFEINGHDTYIPLEWKKGERWGKMKEFK